MNIYGIQPNIIEALNNKLTGRSAESFSNYTGPSFGESLREIARSANIQVASGGTASFLQMTRQKEESLEELFSFSEAEKEQVETYLNRIQKLLKDLTK